MMTAIIATAIIAAVTVAAVRAARRPEPVKVPVRSRRRR